MKNGNLISWYELVMTVLYGVHAVVCVWCSGGSWKPEVRMPFK